MGFLGAALSAIPKVITGIKHRLPDGPMTDTYSSSAGPGGGSHQIGVDFAQSHGADHMGGTPSGPVQYTTPE